MRSTWPFARHCASVGSGKAYVITCVSVDGGRPRAILDSSTAEQIPNRVDRSNRVAGRSRKVANIKVGLAGFEDLNQCAILIGSPAYATNGVATTVDGRNHQTLNIMGSRVVIRIRFAQVWILKRVVGRRLRISKVVGTATSADGVEVIAQSYHGAGATDVVGKDGSAVNVAARVRAISIIARRFQPDTTFIASGGRARGYINGVADDGVADTGVGKRRIGSVEDSPNYFDA